MEKTEKHIRKIQNVKPFKPSVPIHQKIELCMQQQEQINNIINKAKLARCANRVEIRHLKKQAIKLMEGIIHDHSYSQTTPHLPSSYFTSIRNTIQTTTQVDSETEEFLNEII